MSDASVLNGMLCTAALSANLLICQAMQGMARFAAGERAPEDVSLSLAKQSKKEGVKQSFGMDDGEADAAKLKASREWAMRASRNHLNALENVPLGIIVGWASILAAGDSKAQRYLFIAFAVIRCLHTCVYMMALQPWRALLWRGGWICIIGMLGVGIAAKW